MNKIAKSVTAGMLALFAGNAFAVDGTIEFTGQILTSTCEFSDGDTIKVELGHYAAKQFKILGDKTPKIPFTIKLKNCPTTPWERVNGPTDASFQLWLETAQTTGANNKLVAVSGIDAPAMGVGIQIETADGKAMALNQLTSPKISFPITNGEMSVNLVAYYVSTVESGDITPGEANASVDVTLDYR